jgi:hypothetical protein
MEGMIVAEVLMSSSSEARLAGLHQCESVLKATRDVVGELVEQQLPAFARASQNMATMAAL